MTYRLLLPLFMGASLFLVSPTVIADDDDDDDDGGAAAMQVRIDRETGEKLTAEDDSGDAPQAAVSRVIDSGRNSNVSLMIPAKSQPPQYHADGSVSAQIGMEHLKYLVVTKDEDGNNVITHVPAEQFDDENISVSIGQEEE